ncbi:hypothetical protein [Chryseobacterium profundimaris]|uniref:Lower baseplate protein N-terminal domain-containing protein n=1 Tax=Chryseobacterium profundimaris TaxID=1387275 RepID=A0ABY1NR34_9FLAO|nr:hypothetical protein [Chryseobacterium profundimaris]SMP14860.1 hypothetical protein SAMN06264346_10395 [Chryseobacterium profundimaris]
MAVLLYSTVFLAQVGINNNIPKATLDVTAKTTDGSKPEGLLVPRLTGDQIQTADAQYTADQKGIIIYATSAPAVPAGKTANMTAEGYYFFDGSVWQKIINTASGDASTAAKGIVQLAGDLSGTAASPAIAGNAVTSAKILDGTIANADLASGSGGIYKGNGSLSGNTTVAQGANTLAFTSTATNGFSVDGTTLSADAVNDRIGIGTASPNTTLTVNGIISSGLQTISTAGTVVNRSVVSATTNFVLPSAVTSAGAIIYTRNINNSGSIAVTTLAGLMFNGGSTTGVSSYNMTATDQTKTILWISDGFNWTALCGNF